MSITAKAYLFQGISKATLKQIEQIGEEKAHPAGNFLFHAGDPAKYLYILKEGRVRLRVGENNHIAFVLSEPGDVIGWSSMVGDKEYTLSAQCNVPVKVIRFEKKLLSALLQQDASSGLIFFQRLCEVIGQRLVNSYRATISVHGERVSQSYG